MFLKSRFGGKNKKKHLRYLGACNPINPWYSAALLPDPMQSRAVKTSIDQEGMLAYFSMIL